MSELLLEFFCEEIPARMQARAEADLEKLFVERLKGAGLNWDALKTFSGPRRLGLVITGLPTKTEDVREERKGPKVGAPDKAIEGFLRSAGLDSLDQCKIEDGKKGQFYIALIEKPGRATADVVAEAVPDVAKSFPWPKSMKFGEDARQQRWVRPLQRIICLMDGQVVDTEVFGIKASNITEGHRVHGNGPFEVSDFASYEAGLRKNGVILNRAERGELILNGARKVCADAGFELVEDSGLLEEVTGLVEHPVPVLGEMDPEFLDLPPEVITLTMKTHQKYFAVQDKTGKLVSKFVVIANQDAPDGGVAIAAGNARVLSARLSDARHFWDLDLKTGLEAMANELNKVTFHEKLGTVADKTERVATLARELADAVGADPELAYTAAKLAKADLVSQMVYEFPELQGAMGRYYALEAGLDAQIADAIRDHYKPQGPSDAVPTAPVSAAVALADKLDTLVGFWAIDEKPTGSKDPFALRRAALGVIRIFLATNATINLDNTPSYYNGPSGIGEYIETMLCDHAFYPIKDRDRHKKQRGFNPDAVKMDSQFDAQYDLLAFFADRLKVHLKDEGIKHDVIDAVFALGDDDLVRVTNKARALQAFLDAESGTALLAGYRRAANILAAEEKKGFDLSAVLCEALDHPTPTLPSRGGSDAGAISGPSSSDAVATSSENADTYIPSPSGEGQGGGLSESKAKALLSTIRASATASEETALIDAIEAAETAAQAALAEENFEAAMNALAQLRGPVDAFFEAVVVNDEDAIVRRNRLLLLSRIRAATDAVADFSRLEG
ncbi:glycine--tRNA ligase subunit beta [Maricaulaceae bacterium NA33B04]|nr:glycine--tRNA ligase subunit beta [Maricaulaceae bacterium NA33B04]